MALSAVGWSVLIEQQNFAETVSMVTNDNKSVSRGENTIDLDAYLHRIGYDGSRDTSLEVLNGIVHAHVLTIPFENLDVLMGRPIRLDAASLQKKLVKDRRGGYCFEQNGLLLHVLESMGFQVRTLSARVMFGYPRGTITPRTHLVVRVDLNGNSYLADVGVGGLSPTAVLRLELDTELPTPHETRRIIREGALYFHQAQLGGNWEDIYQLTLEEMPLIDRQVANWYTSTHPDSRFRNILMVAKAAPDGVRLTMLNDEFSIRDAQGYATKYPIGSKKEMLDILAEHFDMHLPIDSAIKVPAISLLRHD
ncbi:arylamine N-acetyltransferase family protein [Bremerella sp. T1]|uniref:arylamine N-acetyltransferase family protein n=1 Tax=Bremerella sp. TYQ1 TaxID=3119568 RepID=UPI001CCE1678|nr:arylamine N-acetyltransferase [Bremerella volcania]UBM37283.1 arylamine N-acetyltransferase [Bremerella volcania]